MTAAGRRGPVPRFTLAERLAQGGAVFCGWCGMGVPLAAEGVARAGFAAVVLDMQHGLYDLTSAVAGITAVAEMGSAPIVRVPIGEMQTASRVLDAGAEAVIAPMIGGAGDARRLATFTKYPPRGERSWGPMGAQRLYGLTSGGYFDAANSATLALAMVETRGALDGLDDILATDGVDGVFIGPFDLSIALAGGKPAPDSREVEIVLDKIAARTAAARKIAGVYCAGAARAKVLAGRGYRLLAVGSSSGMLRAGAKAALAELEPGRA